MIISSLQVLIIQVLVPRIQPKRDHVPFLFQQELKKTYTFELHRYSSTLENGRDREVAAKIGAANRATRREVDFRNRGKEEIQFQSAWQMKRTIKARFDSTSALSRLHRVFFLRFSFFLPTKGRRQGAPARAYFVVIMDIESLPGHKGSIEPRKSKNSSHFLTASRLATVNSLPLPPFLRVPCLLSLSLSLSLFFLFLF